MKTPELKDEAINNQYELYKQRRIQREAADKAQAEAAAQDKAKIQAAWDEIKAATPTLKTNIEHTCPCGAVIPAHTVVHVSTRPKACRRGVYGEGYSERVHWCNRCRPVKKEASC